MANKRSMCGFISSPWHENLNFSRWGKRGGSLYKRPHEYNICIPAENRSRISLSFSISVQLRSCFCCCYPECTERVSTHMAIFHESGFHFELLNLYTLYNSAIKSLFNIYVYLWNIASWNPSLVDHRHKSTSFRTGSHPRSALSLLICASLPHCRPFEGWSPAGNPLTCRVQRVETHWWEDTWYISLLFVQLTRRRTSLCDHYCCLQVQLVVRLESYLTIFSKFSGTNI